MARPIKKGLSYFPLDVDFLSDIKVRRIIKACGSESIHILIALLAYIYRDEGYYVGWNDDIAFLVADEVGAKEGSVVELVKKAIQVNFFDKKLYEKYNILTSKGIQERYILATKERKKVTIEKIYLLTNEVNRSNISINPPNNPDKPPSNEQSKVKESKGEESKVEDSKPDDEQAPIRIQSITDFEKLWAFPNHVQRETILEFVDQYGDDLVSAAVKLAGSKDVIKGKSINFLNSALKEWSENNVKTVDQAREYQKNRNKQFKPNQNNWNKNKSNARNESLPDWARDDYEAPKDEKLSPEKEQAIRDKLARIRGRKNGTKK